MAGVEVDVVDGHGQRETPIKHQVKCRFFLFIFWYHEQCVPECWSIGKLSVTVQRILRRQREVAWLGDSSALHHT